MAQCDIRTIGNSLDFLIHVPESPMLLERHSGLKTVRILDPEVTTSLAGKWEGSPAATVRVELMLDGEIKFRYSVTDLRMVDSTIWLDVAEDVVNLTTENHQHHELLP